MHEKHLESIRGSGFCLQADLLDQLECALLLRVGCSEDLEGWHGAPGMGDAAGVGRTIVASSASKVAKPCARGAVIERVAGRLGQCGRWATAFVPSDPGYPFEVVLGGSGATGAALADQVKSLDWQTRQAEKKGKATPAELAEIKSKIKSLLKLS